MTGKPTVICDTECYPNFWSIGFKRISDGKLVILEHSHRKPLDVDRLAAIMDTHEIITYNGMNYDMPMIALAASGAGNARLKQANDRIILGKLKYWEVEDALGVRVPRTWTHIDLIEPQPNAFASLKTLQGRLHGKKMQDLPYEPDTALTEEQMDHVLSYMGNDLDATHNLYNALAEPMALRAALSDDYRTNFRSKSDSQIGEGIIKKRAEQITGEKIERVNTPAGSTFPFRAPEYLRFERPELAEVLERLKTTEFVVQGDGKVELPTWLENKRITIGETTYAMGIGGLHSTEANRAIHSDDDYQLVDFDVASYYPNIILGSGLYPKALGRVFLEVYQGIVNERVAAKRQMQRCDEDLKALRSEKADSDEAKDAIKKRYKALVAEKDVAKTKAEGLKISANGVYGKLGSIWSVLYAPHLMIAVTLTGQLALLMLIEMAEAMGISVVSGNTDGVVFKVPRHMMGPIVKTRVTEGPVKDLIERWEAATGFEMEGVPYRALYNQSVNSYVAVTEDGKVKQKGPGWTGRHDGDMRTQLMKNPSMEILRVAVAALLSKGTPIEDTINAATDIRDFVTVVNVKGGGVWVHEPEVEQRLLTDQHNWPVVDDAGNTRTYPHIVGLGKAEYLGKVVRYYWATDGSPIFYKTADPRTGNFKKVSKTDGSRPLMELPDDYAIPADLDRARYIEAAKEVLMDIGAENRPPPIRPIRIFKYNAIAWFALAA